MLSTTLPYTKEYTTCSPPPSHIQKNTLYALHHPPIYKRIHYMKRFPPAEKKLSGEKNYRAKKTPRPASRPPGSWIWAEMLVFARFFKLFIISGVPGSPARPGHGPASPGLGLVLKMARILHFPWGFWFSRDFAHFWELRPEINQLISLRPRIVFSTGRRTLQMNNWGSPNGHSGIPK